MGIKSRELSHVSEHGGYDGTAMLPIVEKTLAPMVGNAVITIREETSVGFAGLGCPSNKGSKKEQVAEEP
jgi:hypothetical protein